MIRDAGRWRCWCAACTKDHGGDPGRPSGAAAPVVRRPGLGAVGADHARPGRCRLAGPPAAPGRLTRDSMAAAARQHPVAGGGGERSHDRGVGWQPPPGAPGGLAPARPRAAGGGQCRRLRVRQLRAGGPAGGAAGRQLPGWDRQRHRSPVAGLRRLYPAAHPDRVAALAALALVGQGGGRRTRVARVAGRGRPAAAGPSTPRSRTRSPSRSRPACCWLSPRSPRSSSLPRWWRRPGRW